MKDLDRQELDLVARAVVSGRRGFGPRTDAVADFVGSLMKNRLAAIAPAAARVIRRRSKGAAGPAPIDSRMLDLVLRRVEKHLGQRAAEAAVGGSRPR